MRRYEVEGHVPSFLPEGKQWKMIWNDEFDGPELDRTKWGFRLYFWGRRLKAFTNEEAIRFDGKSNIELHLIKKGDDYVAPLLQTASLTYDLPKDSGDQSFWPFGSYEEPRFLHKYGYYECRCKLQRQPGWWSAFWLQAPGIGSTPDPRACGVEVDILESFEPGVVIPNFLHWNGYGKNHADAHIGEKTTLSLDKFHTFAVHWEPDGYTFYIDGVQRGEKFTKVVSHTEQFILVHGECKGYRASDKPCEEVKSAVLPDCFTVDYVRVFDEI
jgi:hypothetical protein